jgi:hypothetical protein
MSSVIRQELAQSLLRPETRFAECLCMCADSVSMISHV